MRKPQRKLHLGDVDTFLSTILKWNLDGGLIQVFQNCVHCKKKFVNLEFNEITEFGHKEVEEVYCYSGI